MTIMPWAERRGAAGRRSGPATSGMSPGLQRGLLVAALCAGGVWAIYATGSTGTTEVVERAGGDLTRLLRFMAVIKATMAVGVSAIVWWRLALPAALGWLLAYLAAVAAMAAGPVLIWGMVHVGFGALLLHGGLLAALVTLWRDPAVTAKLKDLVAARQPALLDQTSDGCRQPRSP